MDSRRRLLALFAVAGALVATAGSRPAWGCKVYWVEPTGVFRANLDGTEPEQVAAPGAGDVALDLSSGLLYTSANAPVNGVMAWRLDGLGQYTIVHENTSPDLMIMPQKVDVAPGPTVFWTVRVVSAFNDYGLVKRIGPSGPEPVLSTWSAVGEVAIDPGAGRFYVTDATLRRADLDGTNAISVVPTVAEGLVVDSPNAKLYWSRAGTIHRADLDGGNDEIVVSGLPHAGPLALDGDGGKLFWGDGATHTIGRIDVDGSGPVVLFSTTSGPLGVAIDPRDVDLRMSGTELAWDATPATTAYGVVRGDLGMLRATHGDFGQATTDCLADDNLPLTSFAVGEDPESGQGFWYLVRPKWFGVATPGSWNACTLSQTASRDAAIASSGLGCP